MNSMRIHSNPILLLLVSSNAITSGTGMVVFSRMKRSVLTSPRLVLMILDDKASVPAPGRKGQWNKVKPIYAVDGRYARAPAPGWLTGTNVVAAGDDADR